MVMVETFGAIWSSTTFSASARSRTVQRVRPAGTGEQARAVRRASKSPQKVSARWSELGFESFFDEALFKVFDRSR